MYHCLSVHGTAEMLDGVAELPDTQTAQQTDVKDTYCVGDFKIRMSIVMVEDLRISIW